VSSLPPNALVTRQAFVAAGNLQHWMWAVRERNAGQVSARSTDSPWLRFVDGQTAAVVRETLAVWACEFGLAPISAADIGVHLEDPTVRDQCFKTRALWRELVQDPQFLRRRAIKPVSLVVSGARPTAAQAESLLRLTQPAILHEIMRTIELESAGYPPTSTPEPTHSLGALRAPRPPRHR